MEGQRLLDAEIEAAWSREKSKLPSYLKADVVDANRASWLADAIADVVAAVVRRQNYKPPVDFEAFPNAKETETAWREFLSAVGDDANIYQGFLDFLGAVAQACAKVCVG